MVPPALARTISEVHGTAGKTWLRNLPDLLARIEADWGIRIAAPLPNLTYHFVAKAHTSDGQSVVLKCGVPTEEFSREAEALESYAGRGAVRLLRNREGAMLLERVLPGTMLTNVSDEEATAVAASVMSQLWGATSEVPFPNLERWTSALLRTDSRFESADLDLARGLRKELLSGEPPVLLLHGDLHHGNILRAGDDRWLAIDPKGVLGDPEFECAPFLLNPSLLPVEVLERRVRILSDVLALDRWRIIAWATVFGILSAQWTLEDHGRIGEEAIEFSRRMARLL